MSTVLKLWLGGALLALSVGVPCALHGHLQTELRAKQSALQQHAVRLSLLEQENLRLLKLAAAAHDSTPLTEQRLHELLRLRNEKRWLLEQTNLLARLQVENNGPLTAGIGNGTTTQDQSPPRDLESAMIREMMQAARRILAGLQPALQKYALVHSNQPPDNLSDLEDYFPVSDGQKMIGLHTFDFVREGGPKPGDALVVQGWVGRQPDGAETRVYGFSDGRVVQVSSEDGKVANWEAQHMNAPLTGTEEKIQLESEDKAHERAQITDLGASVGISAQDASRFFDNLIHLIQEQKGLGQRLDALRKNLAGSEAEKQSQLQAAVLEELNKVAVETLGDKGTALVQKLQAIKAGQGK